MSGPSSIPEVRTARLLLRAIEEEDVDPYHLALFADPEVMRYLPGGEPLPRERLDGLVERSHAHWDRHGYGVWVVCDGATGAVIGQCGLRHIDEVDETEILYAYSRASWGKGLATEAGLATLGFGFDRTVLERIVAYAVPENRASTRVMEKIGMAFEARDHLWDMDLVRFAIGRDGWKRARKAGNRSPEGSPGPGS